MYIRLTILKQLPILNFENVDNNLKKLIVNSVLELTYTAYDMKLFAEEVCAELYSQANRQGGFQLDPFFWDECRRFLIRCELDAAYFHLYGVEREDVDYIMETFPIVKKKDERKYGEYRTKRVILECYDAMAKAMKTGRPYQTILDPPPADPSIAHPAKET